MAERFRGPHSPDGRVRRDHALPDAGGPHPYDGRRRRRAGGRSNILFLAPVPFVLRAFAGDPGGLVLGLAAGAALLLSAWLTREGLRAEQAFDARAVARRPALPRKILGSALMGAGLALGGLMGGAGVPAALAFALIGAGLHLAAFGLDPLRDKGIEGVDRFQADRVARALDEAEGYLAGMAEAIRRAGEPALEARVARLSDTARGLFRTVEADPADLVAARKDLGVYLMAARDATVKFADLHARHRDPAARADYEALLDDLQTHFANRTQALLGNAHTDLDVEIRVLRDRLKLETDPAVTR